MFKKIKYTFFFIIIFFIIIFLMSHGHIYEKIELEYGVTFSKKQASSLGFDWQTVYLSILDDLKIKKLRLPAYWDEIEFSNNEYFWDDLDWQINEAEKRDIEIILAVGGRLPRWPECHFPEWTQSLDNQARGEKILAYIEKTINRYRENKNIIAWQIENEPFLTHFGDCPKLDKNLLDQEIALAHEMDSRPVIITDSGELSFWIPAARRADIFGTTLYRDTYSKQLKRYVHYPISPGFFRFKKNIVNIFASPKKWIVSELQAEPWGPVPYQNLSQTDRDRTMSLKKFKEIIEFSHKAGFKEFYLWGAEYWYWEREQGRPEMWEEARGLF
ncbi:MAG: cellulase family glycosylhydrolase [Patescibacteria group bacterium]